MTIFRLPDLGEGLPDAEIREWHVKPGDKVAADQLLVSMETAKAVVEVPSPQDGVIEKLYGKPGDVIKTGAPLMEFVGEKRKDTGTVAGKIDVGNQVVAETAIVRQAGDALGSANIRALAKKYGVDLSTVKGTAPDKSITAQDVKNAFEEKLNKEGYQKITGTRRVMAQGMSESHAQVVPVTIHDVANISDWKAGTDITFRIMRAITVACKTEPALNAWLEPHSLSRKTWNEIHLGLAMDGPEGLFVPVIKNLEKLIKTPDEVRKVIENYKEGVRARTLEPTKFIGGTITLSNFGMFAGHYANPIIVPPQVAIIGCGKIHDAPVIKGKEVVKGRVLPLSLTMDHRAVTGGEATRFLAAMLKDLELP
jgi:pyruvate dehydrogenase E2 component (dihydrolipoamide acetyltransferase)